MTNVSNSNYFEDDRQFLEFLDVLMCNRSSDTHCAENKLFDFNKFEKEMSHLVESHITFTKADLDSLYYRWIHYSEYSKKSKSM